MHETILYREEAYSIQGAVFDVYREMGCGFLEAVYQECMEKELTRRGIPLSEGYREAVCFMKNREPRKTRNARNNTV